MRQAIATLTITGGLIWGGLAIADAGAGRGVANGQGQDTMTARPGETSRAASLTAACSGCHRAGQSSLVNLARLTPEAMGEKLLAYKTDETGTTVMHRLARGYSDDDIAAIVAYLTAPRER